ncbi:hypothetical protein Neosp_012160 [[Neocosmospora] mangrovei]
MPPIQLKVELDNAPDFADDVLNILNSVLATRSTPVQAAKALDSLCTEESDPTTFLALFCELFHPLARQIAYDSQDQDLLAAVVQALDELPPRTVPFKAGPGETADHVGPLWENLRETVAAHFYDTFGDSDLPASGEEHRKQRKLNLNAFAARVTSLLNLSTEMYFLWAMADGLEGTMKFVWGAPDVINEDPAAVDEYDIKAAAAWMIHAAHVFYGRDEELWKERFAVFRDSEALDAHLRKEAADAYAAMETAETLARRQDIETDEGKNIWGL